MTTIFEEFSEIKEYKTFSEVSVALTCPPMERWGRITEFTSSEDRARIIIDDGEIETTYVFKGVSVFDFFICIDRILIVNTTVKKENDNIVTEFKVFNSDLMDGSDIKIVSKDISMTVKEREKEIYTYVSVKFEKNSEKTLYYLTDIEDLKIGDYVWIPLRDTEVAGIVQDIEFFEDGQEPVDLLYMKKILLKISKEEYEEFWKK